MKTVKRVEKQPAGSQKEQNKAKQNKSMLKRRASI